MDSFASFPTFESNGFHYDSTDFAMTCTSTHIVHPCEIMTCEWEEDDDVSKNDSENSLPNNEA